MITKGQDGHKVIFDLRVEKLIDLVYQSLTNPECSGGYAKGFKPEIEAAEKHFKERGFKTEVKLSLGVNYRTGLKDEFKYHSLIVEYITAEFEEAKEA